MDDSKGFFNVPVALGLISALIVAFLTWIYQHLTKHYRFWSRLGVPHVKPTFPFGSLKDLTLGKVRIGEAYDQVYQEFKDKRYVGVIEIINPVLVIIDPQLIKRVMIKDFNHFMDRDTVEVNPGDFINIHLGTLHGELWKERRHRLSPVFSSGKIKAMYPLITKISDRFTENLHRLSKEQQIVDVKQVLSEYTIDITASFAFGLDTKSIADEYNGFYETLNSCSKATLKKFVTQMITTVFPGLSRVLNLKRRSGESQKIMLSLVSRTVKFREENNIVRGDFLDVLIRLKENKTIIDGTEDRSESTGSDYSTMMKKGLTLKEMTAQASNFFEAGHETTSTMLACVLYELARHPELQLRMCQELDEVLRQHDGKLNYEALQKMKYMDKVINETFRLYPTGGVLHRRCTRDYPLPDSDLVLKKGQKVCVPVNAIHHDPRYYPDPQQFDPERFSPENVASRPSCVFFPFGEGPRSCIGVRLGMVMLKTGLATFFSNFRVDVAPETSKSLKFQETGLPSIVKDVFLKISQRKDLSID